jgi:DNA-binding MarR family transcriptional regulator
MRNELLKKELWDMIRFTNINLETAFKPFVEIYGLTMMQSRILVAVKECEQATVGTVSKIIDVKSGNGSNMCKKLEQEGFIKRIRSIEDERVVKLILTEKGEETLEKVNEDILKKYGPVLDGRTDEEFEQMIRGIKLLNHMLMEFDKISQT